MKVINIFRGSDAYVATSVNTFRRSDALVATSTNTSSRDVGVAPTTDFYCSGRMKVFFMTVKLEIKKVSTIKTVLCVFITQYSKVSTDYRRCRVKIDEALPGRRQSIV
jgi:low affinity Fe/Cu permease